MAKNAAGVAQAGRVLRRGGIEKDAYRLLRLRAKNHNSRKNFVRLMCLTIDVDHTARVVSIRVHEDLWTMAFEISVQLPVATASATVVNAALK